MEIAPGAFHLHRRLTLEDQRALVAECRALVDGPVPAYVPVVRGGGRMHVRMLCLGRHWNGQTYQYEPTRSDFDAQPAPPLPDDFRALAREIAVAAGMTLEADLCILNYYDAGGRMGLHQDKDESAASIAREIDGVRSIAAIVDALVAKYGADDRAAIEADVIAFVTELRDKGLLDLAGA